IDKLHSDSLKLAGTAQKWYDLYSTVMQTRRTLDSTISADSAKFVKYKELIRDPDKYMRGWLRDHGLPKQLLWLNSINDFQVGLVNPTFHPYSIYGVGIRGLNTS